MKQNYIVEIEDYKDAGVPLSDRYMGHTVYNGSPIVVTADSIEKIFTEIAISIKALDRYKISLQ